MARVFISYARKDASQIADELADRLRAWEHQVFLDTHSIRAGTRWRSELSQRVKWADLIVVLVTPASNDSDFVYQEISEAEKSGKAILPIQVDDTPLPVHLRGTWQAAKFRDNNFDAVMLEIQNALSYKPKRRRAVTMLVIGAVLLLVAVVAAIVLLSQDNGENITPGEKTDTAVAVGWTDTSPSEPTDTPVPPSPMYTPTDTPALPSPTSIPTVVSNADWEPFVSDFDGVEMVLVPAGCFMMGSEDGDADEKPLSQQCFDQPFWIDKNEVTNAQFNRLGGVAGRRSTWANDNRPRTDIDWYEARDFCALRSANLPTEAEWEYAARGPDGLTYPWGDTFVGDYAAYRDNSNETMSVGARSLGKSWVGAYDMSGNVSEWTNSLWWAYPYDTNDGRESDNNDSGTHVLRGGAYYSYAVELRAANRFRNLPGIDTANDIGFRCARSS